MHDAANFEQTSNSTQEGIEGGMCALPRPVSDAANIFTYGLKPMFLF